MPDDLPDVLEDGWLMKYCTVWKPRNWSTATEHGIKESYGMVGKKRRTSGSKVLRHDLDFLSFILKGLNQFPPVREGYAIDVVLFDCLDKNRTQAVTKMEQPLTKVKMILPVSRQ